MNRFRALLDPFMIALVATALLASLLPPRGAFAPVVGAVANIAIFALFFLHGAKLSREAIIAGAANLRLHTAVFAATFLVFPLLGLAISSLPFLIAPVATGLLFLTLLPSTVQSSIAFTAIARGNVAAAVCSASFSNLIGIVVTPLLAALLIGAGGAGGSGREGAISWHSVEAILVQLLLPFVTGHLMRPWIGAWVARHRPLTTLVDRGAILLVVYSAFGAAVREGLWHQLSPASLGLIALCCIILLAAILLLTGLAGRLLHFSREDRIVLLFCGSKKSLASGVPMAGVPFAPSQVGMAILPLMLFHQLQLLACAVIARHYAAQATDE
jgi:sodium/bile acid cotransporter 7